MPGSSTDDPVRPGEVAMPFDPAERGDASLSFIGHLRTPWSRGHCPKNIREARETGETAEILLDPAYRDGLLGLEVGQPVQLLYWVARRRDLIVQSPGHADGPRGVFALRSPVRPNPIALACVLITALDAQNGCIGIDAIDAIDGTPVLDLKPWISTVDVPPGL